MLVRRQTFPGKFLQTLAALSRFLENLTPNFMGLAGGENQNMIK